MKLTAVLWLIVLPVIVELELRSRKYRVQLATLGQTTRNIQQPPPCNESNIQTVVANHQVISNQQKSHAIQHIQISIVKQTTMHVNQKSISRQIITQKKLFCKLCACKQKHSSVVGRLTETDQIQIRDDTTSRACLRTPCYTGITTAVTTRIISDFQPTKHRMPYSTFKYPLSNKQPCM